MNGHFFLWAFTVHKRGRASVCEGRSYVRTRVQWNLSLAKCQGTGEMCSLYRKPRFNEFWGKQLKYLLNRGSLYRGSVPYILL